MTSAAVAPGIARAEALLRDPSVGLVAIDLRGTLVRTPKVTALVPELLACGAPAAPARSAQARFDSQVRGSLAGRYDILDWTRFAATEMASMLGEKRVASLDVDAVVAAFEARYRREARRLIGNASFQRLARVLGGRCVIVADGPRDREAAVLAACFGTPSWMPPLISSECLGVNKLTGDFFVRLSGSRGVEPGSTVVVGDRWDKDVAIPREAGCRAVLVGSASPDVACVDSLAGLADVLGEEAISCPP